MKPQNVIMLKLASYNIVFQEVPDEVSLALNISGCPNNCIACHSPHLQGDIGETIDEKTISELIEKYGKSITCVCFMGGDTNPQKIEMLAKYIKETYSNIKTAWYSGKNDLPQNNILKWLDYFKLGPYIDFLGGLNSPITNQRFYKISNGGMIDITSRFYK